MIMAKSSRDETKGPQLVHLISCHFQVPGQRGTQKGSDQAFIKDFGPWTSQELTGINAME